MTSSEAEIRQRLAFLTEATSRLGTTLDYASVLESVTRLAVPHLADWCIADLFAEGDVVLPPLVAHTDKQAIAPLRALRQRLPYKHDASHVANRVIQSGVPILAHATSDLTESDLHRALLREQGARSLLVLPLTASGKPLGVLTLGSNQSGRFDTDAKMAMASDLARCASTALDNARAYRDARHAELAKDACIATLDSLLDRAPVGLAFFDGDGRFVLVNDELARISDRTVEDHFGRTASEVLGSLGDALDAAVATVLQRGVAHREIELVGSTRDPRRKRTWLATIYPVHAGVSAAGVGVVVHDITARKEEETHTRALAELGAALSLSTDVRAVATAVTNVMVPTVVDGCIVHLLSRDGSLRHVAARGRSTAFERSALGLPTTLSDAGRPRGLAKALITGESDVITGDDAALLSRFDPTQAAFAAVVGEATRLVVALVARGRVLGAITLLREAPLGFAPVEVSRAEEIARRVAITIDAAQLHAELQSAVRMRDDLFMVFARDLSDPLTALLGNLFLLERNVATPPREQLQANLRAAATRMGVVTRRILAAAPSDAIAGTFVRCRADELVREALAFEASRVRSKSIDVTVDVPADVHVKCDRREIEEVIGTLVDRAAEVTPERGTLRVIAERNADEVHFLVIDAAAVDRDLRASAFSRLWREGATDDEHRDLALVRAIVRRHGGRVWAERRGRGAAFAFTLQGDDGQGEIAIT